MSYNILSYGVVPPHMRDLAHKFIDSLPEDHKRYGPAYLGRIMNDLTEENAETVLEFWIEGLKHDHMKALILFVIEAGATNKSLSEHFGDSY